MKLLCATLLLAIPTTPVHAASKGKWWMWGLSVAALSAGTAMDIHSSWGQRELNPILRSPDGRFGHRGAAIRISLVGGSVFTQWLVVRKHPSAAVPLTGINIGVGALLGGVSVRNHTVVDETE